MDGLLTDLAATLCSFSFAPMAASSRIDKSDRAANRCAESATLTDMEATVGTYQLYSYGGKQSRSDCYVLCRVVAAKPLGTFVK